MIDRELIARAAPGRWARPAVLLLGACAATAGCARAPQARWAASGDGSARAGTAREGRFEIAGLSRRELTLALATNEADGPAVRVAPDGDLASDLPALAGDWKIERDLLVFEPAFGVTAGVDYAVTIPRAAGDGSASRTTTRRVSIPAPDKTPATVVEAVYPTSDVLPENLLKFYIHFSAPMSRGQAWDNVRLLDGDGRPIELPFLEIDEELWDPGLERLTVLIDPGRIKRGVRPLEEVGPVFVDGGAYTLLVDAAWEDAEGRRLVETHRKAFRIGPPDRDPPDPRDWSSSPPHAGSRERLVVALDEALDHGLLLSAVGLAGPDGAAVAGVAGVEDGEMTWTFTPDEPWSTGPHAIVVSTTLEDLAGNSVGRPFEVDVVETTTRRIEVGAVEVPFEPRESSAPPAD